MGDEADAINDSGTPCAKCNAACCRKTWSHRNAVELDPEEHRRFAGVAVLASKLDPEGHNGAEPGTKVLPYKGGKCVFLGKDSRCSIYEKRPKLCRGFTCVPLPDCNRVGFFLADNPNVIKMLYREGLLGRRMVAIIGKDFDPGLLRQESPDRLQAK